VTAPAGVPETYVACLTPAGSAAIATLALHGPRAWEVVRDLWQPGSPSAAQLPEAPEPGWSTLGRLGQELADEVVVAMKRSVPIPWVEVHCHGGREVVRLLMDTFAKHGVQSCTWQQFERLTQEHPITASAAIVLTHALTARTAAILLDQHQGAFLRAVDAIQEALARDDGGQAMRLLDELVRHASVGRHLTIPWRVVVAGAPNVGKSSLVNALAGFPRCVVAATPGTTRDVVTTLIAVDGWPMELADTAGVREGTELLEGQGIGLALQAATAADLCLWVDDASMPPVAPSLIGTNLRRIINKIDLPPAWDLDQAPDAVRVSARTGTGLDELCHALAQWLVPDSPPPGTAVPFTPAISDRILDAGEKVSLGRTDLARQSLASLCEGGSQ
jgi:tRNA modification GTPase